jgi:predicted CopG family antitoxin
MRYRTVNLRPGTYERLKQYQFGGRSLSDVVDQLMGLAEPDAFYRKALKVHRRRAKDLRKSGGLSISETEREAATTD